MHYQGWNVSGQSQGSEWHVHYQERCGMPNEAHGNAKHPWGWRGLRSEGNGLGRKKAKETKQARKTKCIFNPKSCLFLSPLLEAKKRQEREIVRKENEKSWKGSEEEAEHAVNYIQFRSACRDVRLSRNIRRSH